MSWDFTTAGGTYEMSLPGENGGLWRVTVPWAVAIDGFRREAGRQTSDKGELKTWMSRNEPNFTQYVMGAIGYAGRPGWEDPRIGYEKIEPEEDGQP